MSGDQPLPPSPEELNSLLRRVHFEPRASLGPELTGRVRRGERPSRPASRAGLRLLLAGGVAAAFAVVFLAPAGRVTIDRCCYDLDGGGESDDGVRILAQRDGRVYGLSIYEDRDRSQNLTSVDIIRLYRSGRPILDESAPAGLTTIRQCCHDLDGGGLLDDGLVVISLPPDRVVSAAIYELR